MTVEVTQPKPRIRWSQISKLLFCGTAYEFSYIKNVWGRAGVGLLIGSANHSGIQRNMSYKRDNGVCLPLDEILDFTREEFKTRWEAELEKERKGYPNGGILLKEDERELGIDAVKSKSLDVVVKLAELHHQKVAPDIQPARVEWKWELILKDRPYDLWGTIDLQEHPLPGRKAGKIRDTKNYAKSPSKHMAHSMDQLTAYCLASFIYDGEIPALQLDTLVKTKEVKYVSQETSRTLEDFQVLLRRIDQGFKVIQSGSFMPVDQASWSCSPAYCSYAADSTCRFYRKGAHQNAAEIE